MLDMTLWAKKYPVREHRLAKSKSMRFPLRVSTISSSFKLRPGAEPQTASEQTTGHDMFGWTPHLLNAITMQRNLSGAAITAMLAMQPALLQFLSKNQK